jgi:hypothetical protein
MLGIGMIAKDGHVIFNDELPLDAIGSPAVNFLVEVVGHAELLEEWDKELDADCLSFAQEQDLQDKCTTLALFYLVTVFHGASRMGELEYGFSQIYTDLFS